MIEKQLILFRHGRTLMFLDSMLAVLIPLREMTDTLSGEKSVSISAVEPLFWHICDTVLFRKGDSTLTTEMKQKIRNDLPQWSRYWSSADSVHVLFQTCCLYLETKLIVKCSRTLWRWNQRNFLIEQGIGVDTTEENTQPDQPTGPIPLLPPKSERQARCWVNHLLLPQVLHRHHKVRSNMKLSVIFGYWCRKWIQLLLTCEAN